MDGPLGVAALATALFLVIMVTASSVLRLLSRIQLFSATSLFRQAAGNALAPVSSDNMF